MELTQIERATVREDIMEDLEREISHAYNKFGIVPRDDHDLSRWISIITEEIGEVSTLNNDILHSHPVSMDRQDIYNELIQVAAVAITAAEDLILKDGVYGKHTAA